MAAPSESEIIEKKVCNAFYSNEALATMGGAPGDLSLILVSMFMGGLWLGGNASLTATHFIFELNTLNKVFHTGSTRFEIPLAEIRQVTVKPSWGFKPIELTHSQGVFKVRVRGAKEFADLIEKTAAKAKA